MNAAIVIPVYNHEQRIAEVILQSLELDLPVFVVNDGSTDGTEVIIKDIPGIVVLKHSTNQGKGSALLTGFEAAAARQCEWAVTIDGDGQHNPEDARKLMAAIASGERSLIVGKRSGMDEDQNVPWTSRFGRGFSNFWVRVSGGPVLADSQSGFRLYPLPEALSLGVKARRYQFEVEVLVRARQKDIKVREVPVRVVYQKKGERVSHFRPWLDFMLNSKTFSQLFLSRIIRGIFKA